MKIVITEEAGARTAHSCGIRWTPTLLIADGQGKELWRLEAGSFPADDFLSYLELGLAHSAFSQQDFAAAEKAFHSVAQKYPDLKPEALYWLGVSRYKQGSLEGLKEAWGELWNNHPNSPWAKRVHFLFVSS
ncbi:MAG: tetratricopeptide repeat protein [Armatimonadetes bacterium]|nr:tetratricopeptide repeat protein [Armatimonadota bacterium]MDW8122172.1 tetratricopeptide repeat protein [Armatimonadota bacterium]